MKKKTIVHLTIFICFPVIFYDGPYKNMKRASRNPDTLIPYILYMKKDYRAHQYNIPISYITLYVYGIHINIERVRLGLRVRADRSICICMCVCPSEYRCCVFYYPYKNAFCMLLNLWNMMYHRLSKVCECKKCGT